MQSSVTKKEIKELIMKELPSLIKKDPKVREFIIELTSKHYADRKKTEDRIDRMLEELRLERLENQKRWEALQREWNKKWEENLKRWETWEKRWEETQKEWNKRWEALQREWNKKWEENQKTINRMLDEIKALREKQDADTKRLDRRFDSTIGALGARWGLFSEASFRGGLKAILEELGVKVERYHDYDTEGMVFGRPDQVELDLLIYDNTLIVAEIKSSMSREEMHAFQRKVEFYESRHGKKVKRKIVISPMVEDRAKDLAKELGIEVYSYPEDISFENEKETV